MKTGLMDVRLRRVPGLSLTWSEERPRDLLVSAPDGRTSFAVGPRTLALLDAFGESRSAGEVLDSLLPADTPDGEIDQWLTALHRLRELGLLRTEDGPDSEPPFRSFEEWNFHLRMITDRPRVRAYAEAIRAAVRPGATVLEIGTGTGILAVMAARAGASVVAVERAAVIGMARRVVEASGVADRVRLVRGDSREIELDEPADLLVAELVGDRILNEDLLELTLDARRRLLRPGAGFVPAELTILAAPVDFDAPAEYRRSVRAAAAETGVDLEPFLEFMETRLADRGLVVEAKAGAPGCRPLGDAVVVARIDFASQGEAAIDATARLPIGVAGDCSGVLLSFDLAMAPGVRLTNRPDRPPTHWKNPLHPLPRPRPVAPGDALLVRLRYRPGTDLDVEVREPGPERA